MPVGIPALIFGCRREWQPLFLVAIIACTSLLAFSATSLLLFFFIAKAGCSSLQKLSMRFTVGQVRTRCSCGQFKAAHLFLFKHPFVLLAANCGSLSHWKTQDLHLKSSFLRYFTLKCLRTSLISLPVLEATKWPPHDRTATVFSLWVRCPFPCGIHYKQMHCIPMELYFGFICTHNVISERQWLICESVCKH